MPALTAHLRAPETHARLPFHAGCPICRGERLSGTLASDALVPLRGKAALAVGVLAVTTVGPAGAFAAESDSERGGRANLVQPAGDAVGDGADFDPRGGEGATYDASTPRDDPASDNDPVVVDDDDDGSDASTDPRRSVPPPPQHASPQSPPHAQQAAPQSPPAQSSTPVPAPADAPAPATPPAAVPQPSFPLTVQASTVASAHPRLVMRTRAVKPKAHQRTDEATATPPRATIADTSRPTPIPASSTPATEPPTNPATPTTRTHTVNPGESLWSIANDHLGPNASPAQIAREVHRLWAANKDRIATGDPDLLRIGTRLRLR